MGHGACTHEISKTKTYIETGQRTISKTVITKCGCKQFQPRPHFNPRGDLLYQKETCHQCGHTPAYH